MDFDNITFHVKDRVAVLTLNRPDALNGFTVDMHEEVASAMKRVEGDEGVRCLLITGSGRAFCVGQDLRDPAVNSSGEHPDLGEAVEKHYNPFIRSIMTLDAPVVCAVNGIAAGAGVSVALACDIVIACRSAAFVCAFSRVGVVPDSGATWNLPRAIGLPRAKAMAFLGERISADTAEQWGMIWRCVEDEQLMPEARKLAQHLAHQPTRALAMTKALLNAAFATPLHEQLEHEKHAMRNLGRTHDYREGVTAFLEKRTPQFKGQ